MGVLGDVGHRCAAFLVAALEVLFGHRLFVGEDPIVVLLGRLRAGEDDELRHALELIRHEGRVRTAASLSRMASALT